MRFISNGLIEIDRELSDLDNFAIEFVRVLRKHTKYVIVSGYVSILLGRARASEDIDIIIPRIAMDNFSSFLGELNKNGFYCINAESLEDIYGYLNDYIAVRFAKEGTAIPNIELKFAKNEFDNIALEKTLVVKVDREEIVISHLEMQIVFKEIVLGSPKDIEDARHLRNIAKGHLDERLISKYELMLHGI